MAALTFVDIDQLAFGRVSGTIEERKFFEPRAFRFFTFGDFFAQKFNVGFDGLHLLTERVEFHAIEAALKAIVDPFVNVFNAATSSAHLWIGRGDGAIVVAKNLSTCIQVTILTVHAIADGFDRTFWAQVFGGMGNQLSAIIDLFTLLRIADFTQLGRDPKSAARRAGQDKLVVRHFHLWVWSGYPVKKSHQILVKHKNQGH